MARTYIGIDPGRQGFITVMRPDGGRDFYAIADNTRQELSRILGGVRLAAGGDVACAMEEVHALFGSSAKSTFSFGETFGLLKGLLIALGIPYTLVQPKKWQGEIWTFSDMVVSYSIIKDKNGKETRRKIVDTKATSANAAARLFPTEDFRRTPSCKRTDDNKVDSLLICEYARRKNL